MKTKDNFLEGAKVTKDNQTFAPDEKNKNARSSSNPGRGTRGQS
ncbi:hypothetical protein [Cytobacillus oceanisediminis]|nr:hypothetical protein [Cytobacillus oceanisediminis]